MDAQLIEQAGGTHAVALICGVSDAVVTNWKSRGIPNGWRKYLAVINADVFGNSERATLTEQPA